MNKLFGGLNRENTVILTRQQKSNIHDWSRNYVILSIETFWFHVNLVTETKNLDKSKCTRYEKCVNDVMSTVSSMIDPFAHEQQQLVSLASGFVLDDTVADNLLESEKRGEEQFVAFACDNLLGETPDVFVKLTRNKIQTFSSSKRSTVKDSKGKEINLKMNRDLFARLLLIAKNCQVDLKLVLSYSLGTYPLSLATTSGDLVKTAKSKLFDILEGLLHFSYMKVVIPGQSVYAIQYSSCILKYLRMYLIHYMLLILYYRVKVLIILLLSDNTVICIFLSHCR